MRIVISALALAAFGLAACDSTDPRFEPAEICDPGELVVETIEAGTSPSTVRANSRVVLDYVGTLTATRDTFDANRASLSLPGTIPGFRQGLTGTVVGDSVRLTIPPDLGYGGRDRRDAFGEVTIPACSELQFDLRILDIVG